MDIIPIRKSGLLYQKGDLKTKGIVDLRHALPAKNSKAEVFQSGKKSISGIIKIKNAPHAGKIEYVPKKEWKDLVKTQAEVTPNRVLKAETDDKIKPKNNIPSKKITEDLVIEKPREGIAFLQPSLSFAKNFLFFISSAAIVTSLVFGMSLLQKEIEKKNQALADGTKALSYLKEAGISISNSDLDGTMNDLASANIYFSNTKTAIDELGMGLSGILSSLPINTPLSTAKNIAAAGENVALSAKETAELMKDISAIDKTNFSLNEITPFEKHIENISTYLSSAQDNVKSIDESFVPEEYGGKLQLLKEKLPYLANNFRNLDKDFPSIMKMLGSENRSQKYLFLFENNTEIRAGGGFIGSYAIADLENGKLKNFYIDGIFNPDGQLKEKIVPPMPIQKISAAWSMHDANWFADFPLSAQKVALFYEKTGGPTVDGVIAFTPNVIENMLAVTGPVEMPEYSVTVNKDNFLKSTQLQVEELYKNETDGKVSDPKKFLADLAPKVIEKLMNSDGLSAQEKISKYLRIAEMIEKSLEEKHIIVYHRDSEIENMILRRGWGGQMLNASGDYLSVINSNINGYKTDAVVDETINLNTEIQSDGSIIDTVKITRAHNGGDSDYDWYNRVNADYMRFYVPLGSTLLEATGQTLEAYSPPIDYTGFKTDEDVQKVEKTIKIDPDSGTQIFEESGKTVFANWVYVSPKETVEITYKYKLPYKINFDDYTKPAERYSMLVQKQLGSRGSKFTSSIKIPVEWNLAWASDNLESSSRNEVHAGTDLTTDRIFGIVFTREPSGN